MLAAEYQQVHDAEKMVTLLLRLVLYHLRMVVMLLILLLLGQRPVYFSTQPLYLLYRVSNHP
jgi:hypothetical protein